MASVDTIGVIGAGVMGSEIAQVAAAAGMQVRMLDIDPVALDRGLAHVRSICERRVARGRMSADDASATIARVSIGTDPAAFADCGLVIEAVAEVMDVKRDVFAAIDAAAAPDAILASNTSGLSITEIGRATTRPSRVVGLHFFNPASVMPLLEVVRGADTSDETLERAVATGSLLGKHPVVVRECPGFLVNRVLCRALAEAYRHADDIGADRARVDAAVVAAGPAPMGPFALGDLIGLDTLAHVVSDLRAAYGERYEDGGGTARQVAAGRLGAKSGSGFHDGAAPQAEPDDPARDVAERYYLGALDEACRCLEEEICATPDVDVAMRLGTGWSVGPLAWAAGAGRDEIRQRLLRLASASGPRFAPRPNLDDLLTIGTT